MKKIGLALMVLTVTAAGILLPGGHVYAQATREKRVFIRSITCNQETGDNLMGGSDEVYLVYGVFDGYGAFASTYTHLAGVYRGVDNGEEVPVNSRIFSQQGITGDTLSVIVILMEWDNGDIWERDSNAQQVRTVLGQVMDQVNGSIGPFVSNNEHLASIVLAGTSILARCWQGWVPNSDDFIAYPQMALFRKEDIRRDVVLNFSTSTMSGNYNVTLSLVTVEKEEEVSPPAGTERDVAVTIERVRGLDNLDGWGWADFYSLVSIGGPAERTATVDDDDDITPNWVISQNVIPENNQVPVSITVFDQDGGLRGDDDLADVNPDEAAGILNMIYRLDTDSIIVNGEERTPVDGSFTFSGEEGSNNRAETTFRLEHH